MDEIYVDEEFSKVLCDLAEGYPNMKLRDRTFKSYALGLHGLTLEQVRQACRRAVCECKFFPSAAELRSFAEPVGDEAAILAWTALQQAASVVGGYASLELEDSAAGEALERVFGSWPSFCQAEGAVLGARRNEFLAAYRQARREAGTLPRRLPGLVDRGYGRILASGQVLPVGGQSSRLLPASGLPVNRLTNGGHE